MLKAIKRAYARDAERQIVLNSIRNRKKIYRATMLSSYSADAWVRGWEMRLTTTAAVAAIAQGKLNENHAARTFDDKCEENFANFVHENYMQGWDACDQSLALSWAHILFFFVEGFLFWSFVGGLIAAYMAFR